jgi:hypothetical protein
VARAEHLREGPRLLARSGPHEDVRYRVASSQHAQAPTDAGTTSVASAISRATSVMSRFAL